MRTGIRSTVHIWGEREWEDANGIVKVQVAVIVQSLFHYSLIPDVISDFQGKCHIFMKQGAYRECRPICMHTNFCIDFLGCIIKRKPDPTSLVYQILGPTWPRKFTLNILINLLHPLDHVTGWPAGFPDVTLPIVLHDGNSSPSREQPWMGYILSACMNDPVSFPVGPMHGDLASKPQGFSMTHH